AAIELHEQRGRGMLCTIVAAPEAALLGATCLVRAGDDTVGAIADPGLRTALEGTAAALMAEGREEPRRVAIKDAGLTVYFEPLLPPPVLLIAGAGHVGAAVCHFAARAGFAVSVVDDRPSFANRERLPDAEKVLAEDIVATVRAWPKTADSYFVIVTRGHRHDAVVLREVINAPVAYIGMIGSRRKILTVYKEFLEQEIATAEELARVHAPVGLDIGAVSVDEIAISIVAELIRVRRKGAGDGHGDRAGGGRIAADGTAETALAVRDANRDRDGR